MFGAMVRWELLSLHKRNFEICQTVMMEDLIRLLHEGGHSLVVSNGRVRTFDGRGVADLYGLLNGDLEFLSGAVVADKVVGKAAAALMILGGVGAVHADVLSRPALELFVAAGVEPAFDRLVDHIINRTKTGWCPLESRCRDCRTPEECYRQIEAFIEANRH